MGWGWDGGNPSVNDILLRPQSGMPTSFDRVALAESKSAIGIAVMRISAEIARFVDFNRHSTTRKSARMPIADANVKHIANTIFFVTAHLDL